MRLLSRNNTSQISHININVYIHVYLYKTLLYKSSVFKYFRKLPLVFRIRVFVVSVFSFNHAVLCTIFVKGFQLKKGVFCNSVTRQKCFP